jgi:DNA-binding IclR family transcriptional regulator
MTAAQFQSRLAVLDLTVDFGFPTFPEQEMDLDSKVTTRPADLSRSVQRALAVLERVLTAPNDVRVSELAETLDLPQATVHRMLVNLEARGLVTQDRNSGQYGVGLRMAALCERAALRLRTGAGLSNGMREVFERGVETIGETGYVAVLDGSEVVYIDCVESPHSLRAAAPIGSRRELHCTAVGKVLVAELSEADRNDLLGSGPFEPRTDLTIVDRDALEANLAAVRERGYALDVAEFDYDLVCLGAPVRDAQGLVVAAVGVTGPAARLTEARRPEVVDQLVELARVMSTNLMRPTQKDA